MNEYICLGIIFITTLIIIYYVFDYKEEITEKFEDANVNTKENNKKIVAKSDEKQSICVKPFTVTYDKDKLYAFLVALDDKITGMEYKQKMGQGVLEDKYKDKFQKYDEMYKWYAQKTGNDKAEAALKAEKAAKQFQKDLDKMINEAAKTPAKPGDKVDLTKSTNSVNKMVNTMQGATMDADNQEEITKAMNEINMPR